MGDGANAAQPKHPWEAWDADKKAQFDRALELADGIKNYRNGVRSGNPIAASLFAKYAPHSRALEQDGGLDPGRATMLARYRMHKNGMTDIPTGDPAPLPSDDQIAANNAAFFKTEAGSPERKALWDAGQARMQRSQELYYDDIAAKREPKVEVPPMLARDPDDAPNMRAALANSVASDSSGSM